MKRSEMEERGFTADHSGKVLDEFGNEFRDGDGSVCYLETDEYRDPDEYRYITTEALGNRNFIIIGKPENADNLLGFFKLLYVFEDKHGYNNVFTSMEDFVSYITNDGGYERHCFSNALLEPDHPDYQEGVDAVDRYLIALNNGVEWDKYIPE